MNITYLGHAGWFIETDDVKILCDAWNSKNPAFYNSWYVYPFNDHLNWNKYLDIDVLYVSHLHKDHFDENTLKLINKDVEVIVPKFRENRLINKYKELGFKNFTMGEMVVGNTKINTYVSETIDRMMEDSMILVSDGDKTFLNMNDAELLDDIQKEIQSLYPSIDMLTLQFSGANWYPHCYENYNDDEIKTISKSFRDKSVENFTRVSEILQAKKVITSAGPPAFLDDELLYANDYGDGWSRFPDPWQVDFEMDNLYKILPGYEFNYENIQSQERIDLDKKEYILTNRDRVKSNTNIDFDYHASKNKFMDKMKDILRSGRWLRRFINVNVYIDVTDNIFEINFEKGTIKIVDQEPTENYYLVRIPQDIFCDLVDTDEFDWEIAFLSCRCKFKRNPDMFNAWILSFFRNLDKDLLRNIKMELAKKDSGSPTDEEYFEAKGCKIQKFCPHMKYDLEIHGEIDDEKNTIKCMGHCWEWDLETGEGLNTSKNLKIKREMVNETN